MPSGLGARALSSIAVVLVAVALVFSPRPVLALVLLALAAIGVAEMYALLSRRHVTLPLPLGIALAGLLVISAGGREPWLLDASVFLSLVAPLVWGLYRGVSPSGIQSWALSAVGVLYVGWPLAHIQLLRHLPEGGEWLIFAIACTWASDTGAYLVGSWFGRHKLAPRISPGKTLEGSLGAIALTLLAGTLVHVLADLPIAVGWAILLSALLSVAAQLGDLAESYLKRNAGVKDSGHLLPGHGGLLDRIDGLLWSVVVTYYVAVAVTL